jgi:hypothetical protein
MGFYETEPPFLSAEDVASFRIIDDLFGIIRQ